MPNAAPPAHKQKRREETPAADPFFSRLGEIAVGFSWLESLMEEHLCKICGPKVSVFTHRMAFQAKCERLDDLMKQSQARVRTRYPLGATRGGVIHHPG